MNDIEGMGSGFDGETVVENFGLLGVKFAVGAKYESGSPTKDVVAGYLVLQQVRSDSTEDFVINFPFNLVVEGKDNTGINGILVSAFRWFWEELIREDLFDFRLTLFGFSLPLSKFFVFVNQRQEGVGRLRHVGGVWVSFGPRNPAGSQHRRG